MHSFGEQKCNALHWCKVLLCWWWWNKLSYIAKLFKNIYYGFTSGNPRMHLIAITLQGTEVLSKWLWNSYINFTWWLEYSFFWVILSQKRKSSIFEIIFSWHIKEQSWTNNFQWITWWIYFPFLCPQADWGFLKCICHSNIFNYLSQCFSFVFAVPERAQYPSLWLSIVVFGLGSSGGRDLGISFLTHPDVLKGWENISFATSL